MSSSKASETNKTLDSIWIKADDAYFVGETHIL